MRAFLRFAPSIILAALCAASALLWVRSYWKVDKAWLQILPKFAVDAQLMPGQLSLGGSQTAVRLPVAEGNWFSWPIDSYFADYIPPPNSLLGKFDFYKGGVTLPLWFLVLLTAVPNIAITAPFLLRKLAALRRNPLQTFSMDAPAPLPAATLRRDYPLIPAGSQVQATTVMQVVS